MRVHLLALASLAVFGCGRSSNYELDATTFDSKHLSMIEGRIGIPFPAGSCGLNFFYKDAMFDAPHFAKVSIPASQAASFAHTVEALKESTVILWPPTNYVSWWNPSSNGVHKTYLTNGCLTGLSCCKEGTNWVLYIQSTSM